MKVDFLDLRASYKELQLEINESIGRVLDSGQYIGGECVTQFAKNYSEYTGHTYTSTVSNGLDAITLTLKALDIGPGDEVLVPSHTFVATWLAVAHVGATIVPVKPHCEYYNIDPESIEEKITNKTKAIIPVHLYGHPVDIDPIFEISKNAGIKIIEDAAQAHGANYKNNKIGSKSDATCWSFYPGKNLGAFGDAGAVSTNNLDLFNKIEKLKNYGARQKYIHETIGFNARMDPIQAATLNVKLSRLDDWNDRRKKIAKKYLDGIVNPLVVLPKVMEWADPVWHLFVIRCDTRDRLMDYLGSHGIATLIHYPIQPADQKAFLGVSSCEVAHEIANTCLSLPIGPHLSTEAVDWVIKKINEYEL